MGANQSASFKSSYKLKEKLGEGAFAVVKRCVSKTDGQERAVKIINKPTLKEADLEFAHAEVKMMRDISHDHCIKLFEVFESEKHLYIVMEILTGGELFDRIVKKGKFSEQMASDLVRQLTGALMYLHSMGIVHRDLKPENLIFDHPEPEHADDEHPESKLKITDFGLAKYQPQKQQHLMNTPCGSPGYVAPEILQRQHYGPQVDMWSMGVILYILLCAFPPFVGKKNSELYARIKKGKYSFPDPEWTHISNEAKDLVRGLLTVDPKKRLTPEQVLHHRWITGSQSKKAFPAQHTRRMIRMQAKKNFRIGVNSVIAMNRFSRLMHQKHDRDAAAGVPAGEAAAPVAAPPAEVKHMENLPKMLRQVSVLAQSGQVTAEERSHLKGLLLSRKETDVAEAAARLETLST